MSADIATLGIKVDSSQVKKADADLAQLAKTGKTAENATKDLHKSFSGLAAGLAALGIVGVISTATRMADAWKNVQGRLSLVTASTGELAGVTQSLFDVANRTRNSFEATADLYANLARTTKALGASQGQLLQVTESISQALIVSGANASSSEAALRQLGQAFASGALRGDELNSIMENTPRIASAIADGMGITIGQLRSMGKEGNLTAEAIFNALISQKEVLEREFAKMPVTVAQSFTVLGNELNKYVGDSDKLTGATAAMSGAIVGLSKSIDVIIPSVLALGTALGVGFVANMVAAKIAAVEAAGTLASLAVVGKSAGAALLAAFGGPVGIAITGVTLALGYLYGQSIQSASAISGVEASAKDANARLQVTIARAHDAGDNVSILGGAANTATPLMNTVANAYKNAGDKALYLARAAKAAAIAVAQGNIIDLNRKRHEALGPVETVDNAEAAIRKDRRGLPAIYNGIKGGAGVASQVIQEALGGPSVAQRRATAANYERQIIQESNNLDLIHNMKDTDFAPDPLKHIDAPGKKTKDKKAKSEGKSDAQRELEQQTKASQDYIEQLKNETSEIGKNSVETKMMAAERAAALAPTKELKAEILASAAAWKKNNEAEANKNFKRDIGDQLDQMQFENSLIGLSATAIEKANIQRAITLRIRDAERNGITLDIKNIQDETAALMAQVDAKENQTAALDHAKTVAASMRDAADSVRDMTEGFGELFGTAGEGFSNLINTMFEYQSAQAEIAQQQEEIHSKYRDDQAMSAEDTAEYNRLDQEAARNRIANYGNMLHAAKSFFKEGSTGYKLLEGAERAYRLFQFAMQVKAIIMDTVHTGTSVANSATRASASGVEAVAKAMASLPPPLNFIAAGAVIAFLVAMGVKMVGGGKGGGKGIGGSGGSDSAKATVDAYNGPRDEYGAPTSGYSVLRPGQTNVAGTWSSGGATGGGGAGGGISVGGTTLVVQGSLDSATLPQVQQMLDQSRTETVGEARRVINADIAERSSRQRIGG